MAILLAVGLLVLGLGVLVKSSDVMTTKAELLGRALGWSGIMIGAFILAPGTSLPEVASSIAAVLQGAPEIVAGNITGSNITNICLVLGLAAMIPAKPLQTDQDIFRIDLPTLIGATLVFTLVAIDGKIDIVEALLSISLYAGYLWFALNSAPAGTSSDGNSNERQAPRAVDIGLLLISVVGVAIGAKWTVDAVLQLSELSGIGSEKLAASVVALGTSLPELVVTISILRTMQDAGAIIGNVIGSNIFNSLVGMSVPALLMQLPFPDDLFKFVLGLLPVSIFYWIILQNRKVNRGEGLLLLGLYGFYLKLLIFP